MNKQPTYFFNVADLKDPNDTQGRTYREVNNATAHAIPLGALVEIAHDPEDPSPMDGARLFVVMHGRDCDGTPLYELCADPEDNVQENPRFRNAKWHGGYSERSLTVIRLPGANDKAQTRST
jgi:hypothetical protein